MLTLTAYRGRRLHQLADYFLILYLGLSFVETLVLLIHKLDGFDIFVPALRRNLPLYGLLLLTGLLINITLILFQKKGPAWHWVAFAAIWVVGAFLLDGNVFALPDIIWLNAEHGFYRQGISLAALAVGWGVLILVLGLILRRIYLAAHTAFLKNRATYWTESLGLFFVGIGLIFFRIEVIGSIFLFVAALAFTYLVRTFRLPDLQVLAFQLLSNVFASLLALLIFTLGFLLGERLLGTYSWYQPVLSSVVMAFMLIIFYNPLLEKVREVIQDLIGAVPDQSRALKEYSKSISNVLEVGLLSTISIGLISESLDVKNGALFLVDSIEDGTGAFNWRLRGVKGMGDNLPSLDVLPEKTGFARILAGEQRPLTQTEIDISPDMQTVPANVNEWLRTLDVEVFVPIHAQNEWVGLFALSPKRSGASYTQEELALLDTFADQTAVALQNARLVESLTRINNEFRRAYEAMEAAHEKLERIEHT
ncbi:MAG: GAF domain-containing protein, partial [Chloroflexota bacterium]|nr:GAF domain-containing protein [Chloroflexota bacterium]